ncbi:nucleotidyltransferase family protein [Candidatus Dependentiae bacterium]|nr:nucleotidyltransferase family protein [Candidatus Dependentiae bacterium]
MKQLFISKETLISKALSQIDETAEKLLFVVDEKNTLLGTVSDGDIRRWILKDKSIKESVDNVMNTFPITMKNGYLMEDAKKIMIEKKINCIPVVDGDNRIIHAVRWIDLFDTKFKRHKMNNIPTVIMAGGEGRRLYPFTKILPKPLIPIGDKTILELIIEKFTEFGCKDFYLSLNYKANLIKAYLNDFDFSNNIEYVVEEKPLGTAGSLHLLKNKIKSTFYVSNCDILVDADYSDILEFHRTNLNKITIVNSMINYVIPYGVCEIESGGSLKQIKEKPEFNFLVNTGLYVLEPDTLDDIPENKFYHITDMINDYMKRGVKVGVYPVSQKSWLDMGQLKELQDMMTKFGVK